MSTPTHTRGKYGRKRTDPSRPALHLGRYLTGVVPAHPPMVDYLARLLNWLMLGNDIEGDCITPETRVLTADLNWAPAGDLMPGERLLAFDEFSRDPRQPGGKRPGRRYQDAAVERTDRVKRPCYELEFDDGTVVRSSAGHRWLTGSLCNGAQWTETRHLKAGSSNASVVCKPLPVWETDRSWEAGYLAAALDGEGCVENVQTGSQGHHRVSFAQVDNPMLAEVERCLKALGFDYRHDIQPRGGNSGRDGATRQDIHRLTVGRRADLLRLLGSTRPQRILSRTRLNDLGRLQRTTVARLVRKTPVGAREVVMLDTTSRTYFAEGLASHNCVAVTWANLRRLITAYLSTEFYPPQAMVDKIYATQNAPGEDDGMDIQTLLIWLTKNTPPDGTKLLGYAKVDFTNPAEVQAAIGIGLPLWVGFNVQQANEDQFDEGLVWDYVKGSPVVGGHSVLTAGYGATGTGQLGGDEKFITWAEECSFTDKFWAWGVDECWATIWPEHLGSKEFLAGLDLNAFSADYTQITGKPFPAPVPPVPPPTPGPVTADAVDHAMWDPDAADVVGWCRQTRTRPDLVDLKAALQTWAAGKGLSL